MGGGGCLEAVEGFIYKTLRESAQICPFCPFCEKSPLFIHRWGSFEGVFFAPGGGDVEK
jgi:hypothetical protein